MTSVETHLSKSVRPVIGFIGLGKMGAAMATNLIEADYEVHVYNRTYSKAEVLAKLGAHAVHNVEDLHHVDVLFSMLESDQSVQECILNTNLLSLMQSNKEKATAATTTTIETAEVSAQPSSSAHAFYQRPIHICSSTLSAKFVMELTELHASHNIEFVCMPVLGRPTAAAAAQLHLLFAGNKEVYPLVSSIVVPTLGYVLHNYGTQPVQAAIMKISFNFIIATTIESLSEGAALVQKFGIAPREFVEMLTSSLFDCKAYRTCGNIIAERQFYPPGANLQIGLKDIGLALQLSETANAPMPFASIIKDTFLEATANGMGDWDWIAVALLAERHAGIHHNDKFDTSETGSNEETKRDVHTKENNSNITGKTIIEQSGEA